MRHLCWLSLYQEGFPRPEVSFSDFVWSKEKIGIRVPIDTCFERAATYQEKLFHYCLYGELVMHDATTSRGFGMGAQLKIKDKFTVSGGTVYRQKFHRNLSVGFLF